MKLLNGLVCAFGLASLAGANPSWKLDKSCKTAGKAVVPFSLANLDLTDLFSRYRKHGRAGCG